MRGFSGAILVGLAGLILSPGYVSSQATTARDADAAATRDAAPTLEEMAEWAESGEVGVERVRAELLHRLVALPSREATTWVHLLSVLGQIEPGGAPLAIRGLAAATSALGVSGAESVLEGLPNVPAVDRPPLLALAAHLAETEDANRAGSIRADFLDAFPDAPEAPEMRLLQAKWLLDDPEDPEREEQGMRLLEELIVDSPEHPLAPEARRLYEANGGRGRARSGNSGR